MRRTDLSRRLGKIATLIKANVNEGKDIEKTIGSLHEELGLKASKPLKTTTGILVSYEDKDFQGTLKKSDILSYSDSANEGGVKDIKTLGAIVKIEYMNNSVENDGKISISLVAEAEYKDNMDKTHLAYPVLKQWDIDIENTNIEDDTKEGKIIKEDDNISNKTKESVSEDDTKNYKKNITRVLTILFANRFFGSIPSETLCNLVIDKIHCIYLVKYLEDIYSNIEDIDNASMNVNDEKIAIVKRILDIL